MADQNGPSSGVCAVFPLAVFLRLGGHRPGTPSAGLVPVGAVTRQSASVRESGRFEAHHHVAPFTAVPGVIVARPDVLESGGRLRGWGGRELTAQTHPLARTEFQNGRQTWWVGKLGRSRSRQSQLRRPPFLQEPRLQSPL